MRRTLRSGLRVATTLISVGIATLVLAQPASPTTAPASQPASRPAMTLYACVLGRSGLTFTGSAVADLPVLQQVEPQFFADKVAYAKRLKLGVFVDYEEGLSPLPGIAGARDMDRLTKLDAFVAEMHRLLTGAREGAGIKPDENPPRVIGAYTDLPIGQRWQYDDDQTAYIADNHRVAVADPLRDADVMCVHVYLHGDDLSAMTPERVAVFVRRRVAAARAYDKRIILFVSPTWVHTQPAKDVSDELLRAIFTVAQAESVDVCIWTDTAADVAQSRRQVLRVIAARDAVVSGH